MARQRVRAQIEADKEARRAKAAADAGKIPASPVPLSVSSTPILTTSKKDYSETKLQVGFKLGKYNTINTICF